MPPPSPPPTPAAHLPSPIPQPHPLAERLITRLQARPRGNTTHVRVLEIGPSSGRNTNALRNAGIETTTLPDVIPNGASLDAQLKDRRPKFSAALATHSLLHGSPSEIANLVETVAEQLKPQGLLYATFGSQSDARFGTGEKLGQRTYAPVDGDERGVPHTYFSEAELRALLEPYFEIERIEEINVDAIAGKWAHQQKPLANAVHWFIEASLRFNEVSHWTRSIRI